ncbi:MAG: 4a-hydroxytetrahydrobiopterin dehydratase [Phycisphaerales bacterium]|nr:4a-hydroxytetrahydrobiopterin dehydratase [Phycisphaerales bacterium]
MEKMTEEQIETSLQDLPQWSEVNGVIQRTYQFKDFLGSMDFVQKIAAMAEERQHHPDILVRYNKVTLTLSTHDAGGITDKDFDFASAADVVK